MTSLNGGLGLALFDDQYVQNPYPLYAQMHQAGHVHRIGKSPFYAVSSWDAVNEAVARCDDFSSNLTATMMYQRGGIVTPFDVGVLGGPTQALATADEPAHSVHRKAILPHLAAKRIHAFEPFIADTAERIWHLNVRDGVIEWMGAMANRLPMMIVAKIIGVPEADIDKLIQWGYSATQVVEGLATEDQMEAAGIAVLELSRYITEHFQQAAAEAEDNLLGDLAMACAAGELDDLAALTMMITLFSAGGESTASLIGSAAWILTTHPDIQQQVRGQPGLPVRFSKRCCATSHRFGVTTGTSSTTPTCAASNFQRVRVCSCCGERPIMTRRTSKTPHSFDSTGLTGKATSPLARERISASERRWPGWRPKP